MLRSSQRCCTTVCGELGHSQGVVGGQLPLEQEVGSGSPAAGASGLAVGVTWLECPTNHGIEILDVLCCATLCCVGPSGHDVLDELRVVEDMFMQ